MRPCKLEQSFPQSTKRFQLESWAPILQEEGLQVVRDVEKKELAVLADLLPKLLGQNGRRAYEEGNDRVTRKEYNSFLEGVQRRVSGLLTSHKAETMVAKTPMTRQRIATDLQVPSAGAQMKTSQEFVEIMCAMSYFYASAVETLRRELVGC